MVTHGNSVSKVILTERTVWEPTVQKHSVWESKSKKSTCPPIANNSWEPLTVWFQHFFFWGNNLWHTGCVIVYADNCTGEWQATWVGCCQQSQTTIPAQSASHPMRSIQDWNNWTLSADCWPLANISNETTTDITSQTDSVTWFNCSQQDTVEACHTHQLIMWERTQTTTINQH